MIIKLTKKRVVADERGLIVLNLRVPADLHILSSCVWLTHSLSNQDYVLRRATTLSLVAGKVVIEGCDERALVEVSQKGTTLRHLWQRIETLLRRASIRRANRAVCICTSQ